MIKTFVPCWVYLIWCRANQLAAEYNWTQHCCTTVRDRNFSLRLYLSINIYNVFCCKTRRY